MKTLKLLAMLGALGGVLLFGTGCNSTEQPIDEKYTGDYSCPSHGKMTITKTTIYSNGGLKAIPTCKIDGKKENTVDRLITWDPVAFNYHSDQKYDFTADVTARNIDYSGIPISGKAEFEGMFTDNAYTWDVSVVYEDSDFIKRAIWFSKQKPSNSAVAIACDGVDENSCTYDMNANIGDAETDLLEENSTTFSEENESHDNVDDIHSYDIISNVADSTTNL